MTDALEKIEDVTVVPDGEPSEVSGTCETHGDFVSPAFYVLGKLRNRIPRCPTCTEIEEAEKRAAEEEKARQRAEWLAYDRMVNTGIPVRSYGSRFANYETESPKPAANKKACQDFAEQWEENYRNGSNLVLCGSPGTGKTHLASAIVKQVVAEYRSDCQYTTVSAMLRYIRDSYSRDSHYSESEAISRYAKTHLLVMDEIGVKLPSDNDKALLFEIIDIRYQEVRPTVMISNLNISELIKFCGERLMDRISQNGTVLAFDWKSNRSGS